MLNALRDAHSRNISHGDVKSENILVTSWNWVYLTDFASYKPTYLPLDDPSDFAFYFDTSGRRSCYVAPERFFASSAQPDGPIGVGSTDRHVTEAMDVFSAGCVIAELFREGAPLFTLSQLFKYREGELNHDGLLTSVEDASVRVSPTQTATYLFSDSVSSLQNLIKDMIALNPSRRPTFDALLHNARGAVFPEVFYSFLHGYVWSINDLPIMVPFTTAPPTVTSPEILTPTTSTASAMVSTVKGGSVTPLHAADAKAPETAMPRDADHKVEKIWADYESVEPYLLEDIGESTITDVRVDYAPVEAQGKPFQVCLSYMISAFLRIRHLI